MPRARAGHAQWEGRAARPTSPARWEHPLAAVRDQRGAGKDFPIWLWYAPRFSVGSLISAQATDAASCPLSEPCYFGWCCRGNFGLGLGTRAETTDAAGLS